MMTSSVLGMNPTHSPVHGTVEHLGVPIRLFFDGTLFYADYRAISGFVGVAGDVAVAQSEELALRQAQNEIDCALEAARPSGGWGV